MSHLKLKGHEENVERFRRAIERERLPSTFLFVGPAGIGKRTFAVRLAAALLCRTATEPSFDPCGTCPDCLQVAAGSHPDLEYLAKPPDKTMIPVELFIGDREHRGREGLCHRLSLKPSFGRRKIAIVDDADNMNVEGANCLLKTLEEPPVGSVLVLIATSLSKQLPTIRSRCQIVRFRPLSAAAVAELLREHGVDPAAADEAAMSSDGSLESAMAHLDGGLGEFRSVLLHSLTAEVADSVGLAKAISKHVNDAGQDTASRRSSFRLVLNAATTFYRQQMYATCGIPAETATGESSPGTVADAHDIQIAVTALECCLETRVNLESNANLTTLIECFADDLGQAGRWAGI